MSLSMLKNFVVIKRFGMFEYNPKSRGHKIVWYNIDDSVNQTVVNRITPENRSTYIK